MIHLRIAVSFLSAALLAGAAAAPNPPPTFQTATPYPMPGSNTIGPLTTVDLNGDGKPDLLFIDIVARTIVVEPGNGNGTFQPAVSSPGISSSLGDLTVIGVSQGHTFGIITGDFNADGITDVLLYTPLALTVCGGYGCYFTDVIQANVQILFGNGDGTFRAGPLPSLGFPPGLAGFIITPANFDGDRATDLFVQGVASQPGYHGFSYAVLNQGNGTFGDPIPSGVPYGYPNAPAVEVADLNGDGFSDLIAYGDDTTGTLAGYQVFLSNGNGTFTSLPAQGTTYNLYMTTADFNHDGKADLLGVTASSTMVLLGNGDGTFQIAGTMPSSPGFAPSVADVNGDGLLDLVSQSNSSAEFLTVALGGPGFTFQNPTTFPIEGSPFETADLNWDGKADVIVQGSNGDYTILFGQSASILKAPRVSPVNSPASIGVLADFNGDGKPDVAGYFEVESDGLYLMEGNGDGSFANPVSVPVNGMNSQDRLTNIFTADFNRDGKPDMAALFKTAGESDNSYLLSVLLGNGDGTFQQPVLPGLPFSSGSPLVMKTADLNGDGIPDIYLIWNVSGTYYLYALLGNGDGTFRPVNNILDTATNGYSNLLDAANVDASGDLVLFWASASQNRNLAEVLLSKGDGTFQFGGSYYPVAAANPIGAAIAVGDVNNDGIPDLLAIEQYSALQPETLTVLLGTGNHTFAAAPVSIPLSFSEGLGVALADMNNDGDPDIVLDNEVLTGNGDGTFQPGVFLGGGSQYGTPTVADVNGDGKPDVIFPGVIEAILNTTVNPSSGCASGTGAQISVASGGFQFNHATQSFVQTVTLTNNGQQAVGGPILLVLDGLMSSNATLRGAGGVTQCNAPLGSPWITVAAGTLGAGQSDSLALTFYDPTEQAIHYTARVLHGSGQP